MLSSSFSFFHASNTMSFCFFFLLSFLIRRLSLFNGSLHPSKFIFFLSFLLLFKKISFNLFVLKRLEFSFITITLNVRFYHSLQWLFQGVDIQETLPIVRIPQKFKIAFGRSSRWHPMSVQSWWMYVSDGQSALVNQCVVIHHTTSFMSSSLSLQQCAALLVHLG